MVESIIGIIVLYVIAAATIIYTQARARQIAANGYFFTGVFVQLLGVAAAIFTGYQIGEILKHV